MARYYFDLREDDETSSDEEGIEFSSLAKVQEEAAQSLADMARDTLRRVHNGKAHEMAIEVRDEDGPVMQVRFTFDINHTRQ